MFAKRQVTAWALERIYPKRFSRPDVQFAQQINVGTDSGKRGIVMSAETCKALSDAYDRRMAEKRATNGASGQDETGSGNRARLP